MGRKSYAKNGKTQGARNQGCGIKGSSRSLGTFQPVSCEHGANQVGTSREDSLESNTLVLRRNSLEGIAGKLIGQLIREADKQLAYHEQQVAILKNTVEELRHLSQIKSIE